MALILFLPDEKEPGEQLLRIINDSIPAHEIEIYHSFDQLAMRLQQPHFDISVAVLCAATRADLMEIIYLGDLLGELKVVLILPDNNPEYLEKAYHLRPRFIASTESDFKYLASVLKKMIKIHDITKSE